MVTRCSSESGVTILSKLLAHSDNERLNDFSPDKRGLGLLHHLATARDTSKVFWLVKELVGRGVNINQRAKGSSRHLALVYHLLEGSFQIAELLLEPMQAKSINMANHLIPSGASTVAIFRCG